jgi:hypothetical protein
MPMRSPKCPDRPCSRPAAIQISGFKQGDPDYERAINTSMTRRSKRASGRRLAKGRTGLTSPLPGRKRAAAIARGVKAELGDGTHNQEAGPFASAR